MSTMYRFMIVDVFTPTALAGNQLAVFSNAMGMSDELMQRLACEMGFSETAFVLKPEQGGDFRLRIFTPQREVAFAGHPTLGAAFALAGPLQSIVTRVETGAGIVPVALEREGAKVVFGRMSQPVPTFAPYEETAALFAALGVSRSELPVEVYENGLRHILVNLPSFADVAKLKPDTAALETAVGESGVSAFAVEDGKVKTRMFAPGLGVVEDAATGGAAGPIAVHLARNGVVEWEAIVEIEQGAEIGRPSFLYAWAFGDADAVTAVDVGGSALVVARGEFGV